MINDSDLNLNEASHSFIFSKKTLPNEAAKLLRKNNKRWLIRESSTCDGCLSVTKVRKSNNNVLNYRYAFVDGEWMNVGYIGDFEAVKESMTPISLKEQGIDDAAVMLLDLIKQTQGRSASSMLFPSRQEATINIMYSNYFTTELSGDANNREILLEELNGLICPITLTPIVELDEVAVTKNGDYYEPEAIRTWLEKEGTCPMTRNAHSVDELKFVTVIKRLHDKINNVNNHQSDEGEHTGFVARNHQKC